MVRFLARTGRLPQLAALAVAGVLGVGAGVLLAARQISGPQRPALAYGFTPFEVGIAAENVSFTATDGTRLAGWWFDRPSSDRVVVVCHGHRGNKSEMLGIGPGLWREGFTVLVFDFRGNGDSEDGPQSLAHYEQRDLSAAIDLVRRRCPSAEIDVVGFSMGASVALLVAAEDQRIRRVVADSAFADIHGVIAQAARRLRLLPFPLVYLTDQMTRVVYGYRFAEVEPVAAVGRIAPRPLLLLHGMQDSIIPVEHAHRLAEAAGPGCELRTIDGVDHCGGYFADRPGYITAVAEFLRR